MTASVSIDSSNHETNIWWRWAGKSPTIFTIRSCCERARTYGEVFFKHEVRAVGAAKRSRNRPEWGRSPLWHAFAAARATGDGLGLGS